jgi:glycosyltransferase involved in cell wall biosynthesis
MGQLLKVAMVRTTLHKGSGQVEHISEISKRLRYQGTTIKIFAREVMEDLSPIETEKVNFACSSLPFIRHFGFMAKCGMIIGEFDIIHTQYHPAIFTGNFVRALRDIPHIFTFHGYAPIRSWYNPTQRLKMLDHRIGTIMALHTGVDRIISISNYIKDILLKFYRVKNEKISVIHNGVDVNRFQPNLNASILKEKYDLENSLNVLYLGRMDPYKGIHFLLKALPLILEELPRVKIIIGGATRFDAIRFKDLMLSKKIRKSIIFTGYLSKEDIPLLYASCDVFCYPSMWEGFGLTPAEAQASGKPVVAFNHCAIPEIVNNNETGILVNPGDHHKMAEATIQLLKDTDLRYSMGKAGRKRVEKLFSWDSCAEKTLELYKRVTE